MTTVSQLVERIVSATGKPGEDVRARAKRLRQSQMLPSGPRGRGAPHIDSTHAVALLLTVLAGNPQVRAEHATTTLWRLQYHSGRQDRVVSSSEADALTHTMLLGPPGPEITAMSFGEFLIWLVEQGRTEPSRQNVRQSIKEISVWQTGATAAVTFNDGRIWWYSASTPAVGPAAPVNIAPALTVTTVPALILAVLADCVNDIPAGTDTALAKSDGASDTTTVTESDPISDPARLTVAEASGKPAPRGKAKRG